MKVGHAVIGAGFGDEGKGLITDYLVRKHTVNGVTPLNVRCNGGAQAGHTVVDGTRRHVFSHVGAGFLAGAPTYLSSKFISNPFVLHQELVQLKKYGKPVVEVHPDSLVTTAFDMIINGLREIERGNGRHGSCGMGVNETITRSQAGYPLTVDDLRNVRLGTKLDRIFQEWWFPAIKKLNNSPEAEQHIGNITLAQEQANLEHAHKMFNHIGYKPSVRSASDTVIFEGAQGLELDEFLGEFPHVTRSVTGLPSALVAAHELGVTEINPIYVTRTYKTRHGAGRLEHEGEEITDATLVDATNVTGRWQGKFRYAPLDIFQLAIFISADLERSKALAEVLRIEIKEPVLAVTHLDDIRDHVNYYDEDHAVSTPMGLILDLNDVMPVKYIASGPQAKDVSEV